MSAVFCLNFWHDRFALNAVVPGVAVNPTAAKSNTVFFFDVDNTLLDNDRVADDLKRYLIEKVGASSAQRYWEIFEQLRTELGYADYLGALQRYRVERPRDPKLLAVSHFMINYPFANRLFPESLDAVEYAKRLGKAVILSDGEAFDDPATTLAAARAAREAEVEIVTVGFGTEAGASIPVR